MVARNHVFGVLCAVLICSVQAASLPESDKGASAVPVTASASPSVSAPSDAPSVPVQPPAPAAPLTVQASDSPAVVASPETAAAPAENSATIAQEKNEDDAEVEKSTVLSMSLQEATDFLKRDPIPASPVKGFAVVGDWGCVNDRQRAVAEQMNKYMEAYNSTFVVALGDNFYEHGVKSADDAQFQSTFEAVYNLPLLQRRWYVILGNHDHRQSVTAQMDYTKKSKRWFLPARYYSRSFHVPGAKTLDMIFVDTVSLLRGDDDQLNWLKACLAASRANYLFVSGHHPVYSQGEHGSTHRLIRKLKPLFETYKVSAYLSGHDHSLQLHVDNGVNYVVSGAGCKQGWFPQPNKIPHTQFGRVRNGFTLFSFADDGASLNTLFVDLRGQVLHQFAIQPRA